MDAKHMRKLLNDYHPDVHLAGENGIHLFATPDFETGTMRYKVQRGKKTDAFRDLDSAIYRYLTEVQDVKAKELLGW